MATRSSPNSSSELTVVMYIIYTNLNPRSQNAVPVNRIPIPQGNANNLNSIRMSNSFQPSTGSTQIRERASTILLPTTKTSFVVPVRSSSIGSDQPIANNIPPERNVEYFK